jgi:hypothetical protein
MARIVDACAMHGSRDRAATPTREASFSLFP